MLPLFFPLYLSAPIFTTFTLNASVNVKWFKIKIIDLLNNCQVNVLTILPKITYNIFIKLVKTFLISNIKSDWISFKVWFNIRICLTEEQHTSCMECEREVLTTTMKQLSDYVLWVGSITSPNLTNYFWVWHHSDTAHNTIITQITSF